MKNSSISFKPFSQLLGSLKKLEDVPGIEKYWGHTPGASAPAGRKEELLTEHANRVNDTSLQLIAAHGLEPVVDALIADLLEVLKADGAKKEAAGNFIKTDFLAAIVFHDFGKLNENYQLKLGNSNGFQPMKNGIDSGHSILGAHLWIEWAGVASEQIGLDEVSLDYVTGLAFDFADVILNHHSSAFYVREMKANSISGFEKYCSQLSLSPAADYIDSKRDYQEDFSKACHREVKGEAAFARYALVKLCFSLLTASDYLATLGYMTEGGDYQRLSAKDLGIFSAEDVIALRKKFWDDPVNRMVGADPEAIAATPWTDLQEKSNDHLNALRRKLLAEVVLKIRKQPEAFLYYLEAPTGAGKTNLSLALALELMTVDTRLSKVFYVFPFTTLITQTTTGIKEKLGLENDNQIVQLHSKAEITAKEEDGVYGKEWINHVDRLFVQYPITLLSHVRFFDILKSNGKEINYLLHRLANSVVVIDEVQSYSPLLWQHVDYLLSHYARRFNIRFVVMSATLPKLYLLGEESAVELVEKPEGYFRNPNFSGRVRFSFELWKERRPTNEEKPQALEELAQQVAERCENYAAANGGQVSGIIEFITKKSAAAFAEICEDHPVLGSYEILVLSGSILEPRRQEIVRRLKSDDYKKAHPRILLVCTQVVEAGVDIDMDIGFKDSSLLDSDEQLAGRVNRNARRPTATVYLFNLDRESGIYGKDPRLKAAQELGQKKREEILCHKSFYHFYNPIIEEYKSKKGGMGDKSVSFTDAIRNMAYKDVDGNFRLIDNDSESVFVPLNLPLAYFSESEKKKLADWMLFPNSDGEIAGEQVFEKYLDILTSKGGDFIQSREGLYSFQSILSKFTLSVFPTLAAEIRKNVPAPEKNGRKWNDYGFVYLDRPDNYYDYKTGFKDKVNFSAVDQW